MLTPGKRSVNKVEGASRSLFSTGLLAPYLSRQPARSSKRIRLRCREVSSRASSVRWWFQRGVSAEIR